MNVRGSNGSFEESLRTREDDGSLVAFRDASRRELAREGMKECEIWKAKELHTCRANHVGYRARTGRLYRPQTMERSQKESGENVHWTSLPSCLENLLSGGLRAKKLIR